MSIIDDFDGRFVLGVEAMDATHREFVDLVNALADSDKAGFAARFPALLAHTREHFAAEDRLMEQCGFRAIAEHRAEHARLQGELERFAARVAAGRTQLARAYVVEQIPQWFALHAATMDSALAACLTAMEMSIAEDQPVAPGIAVRGTLLQEGPVGRHAGTGTDQDDRRPEIGLVGKAPGRYQLLLGGDGSGTRLNRLYRDNLTEDGIIETLDGLFAKYAARRAQGERFGDFLVRTGEVRAVVNPAEDFHTDALVTAVLAGDLLAARELNRASKMGA
jgi:hemerythrin